MRHKGRRRIVWVAEGLAEVLFVHLTYFVFLFQQNFEIHQFFVILLKTTEIRSIYITVKKNLPRDTWMAQSVKCPMTSAQVMISQCVSSSPVSSSELTAQSLKPASDSVSPSLSAPPLLSLSLSLSQKQIHIKKM